MFTIHGGQIPMGSIERATSEPIFQTAGPLAAPIEFALHTLSLCSFAVRGSEL